jgi:hypothetical protein
LIEDRLGRGEEEKGKERRRGGGKEENRGKGIEEIRRREEYSIIYNSVCIII